jgi:hypothetical protein
VVSGLVLMVAAAATFAVVNERYGADYRNTDEEWLEILGPPGTEFDYVSEAFCEDLLRVAEGQPPRNLGPRPPSAPVAQRLFDGMCRAGGP